MNVGRARYFSMSSMHQEHSLDHSAASSSTAATTPEQLANNMDDIWASDSHDENHSAEGPASHELLSDLPTIKRQHMTDGYREGLAVGKAKVMQQGFDDGYPIGIQIALRVGRILGILEGYMASKSMSRNTPLMTNIQKVYEKAKAELSCQALLKDMNDEVIAEATTIPSSIENVIIKWEHLVIGTSDHAGT